MANMIDIFKDVKRFFREDDIWRIDIDMLNFEYLGYDNKEDFLECIKPMNENNIYGTSSPIFPFMYSDFENSCHFELYDLSKTAMTTFVQPDKRIQAFKEDKGNYRHLYFMMQSNIKALDFIKNYHRIPKNQLKEVFLYIYQSMDYAFDIFPDEILDDIFRILKEENNTSDKLVRIYRGSTPESTPLEKAFSWTTSKKIAKFFANRFQTGDGIIYRGYIRECDIVHRDRDGEFEVLCKFEDVQDIKEIE